VPPGSATSPKTQLIFLNAPSPTARAATREMQFLISMHINPAILDALTDEEKPALGDRGFRAVHGLPPAEYRMSACIVKDAR
jgi:hypothetical protein